MAVRAGGLLGVAPFSFEHAGPSHKRALTALNSELSQPLTNESVTTPKQKHKQKHKHKKKVITLARSKLDEQDEVRVVSITRSTSSCSRRVLFAATCAHPLVRWGVGVPFLSVPMSKQSPLDYQSKVVSMSDV